MSQSWHIKKNWMHRSFQTSGPLVGLFSYVPTVACLRGKYRVEYQEVMRFWHVTKQLKTATSLSEFLTNCRAVQLKRRHWMQTVLCGTLQTPPEASFERGYLVCSLSYFHSASVWTRRSVKILLTNLNLLLSAFTSVMTSPPTSGIQSRWQ